MRYAACPDQNYDDATGTCTGVVFVQQPTLLPEVSAADAAQISAAIIAVCALAWGIKVVVRLLFNSR